MSLRPGAVNFEQKWSALRRTITALVQLERVEMSAWNDHYSDIYALCEAFPQSYAEKLYSETQALLTAFVADLLQLLQSLDPHSLLLSYQRHWLKYRQGARYLDNLFSYFNRVSLRKYQKPDGLEPPIPDLEPHPPPSAAAEDTPVEIRNMALRVWREGLIERLKEPVIKALLKEVQRDREGQSANLTMVRDIVSSLIEVEDYSKDSSLQLYQDLFEGPFLVETGGHYRKESAKLVAELTCSEYLHQVVAKLQVAKRQGDVFLHQSSITKFIRECEARMIEEYKADYLYSHTRSMIQEEQRKDLSNLFLLLSPIPKALDPVVAEFEEHVRSQGLAALSRLQLNKNPNVLEFMSAVLDVHNKFTAMTREVFGGHKAFHSALDQACRAFVNLPDRPRQPPKAPLLLARYCDQLLRKSSKGGGEQEVEDKLEHAITVFRYVDDKDLFQRFYSRMLSRRLVQSLSLSMEAEESMIQKLKHACGYEYTARLQRMVVDIRLSADGMAEFQEQLSSLSLSLPLSFSTLVLQSAAWPLSRMSCGFAVPTELLPVIEKFERFYVQKHSGRKLSWLHNLSLGELKMLYLRRPYTVCVTTFQMALLLAFNSSDLHTYSSLLQLTQLGLAELTACLQSLVECKLLLLDGGEVVEPSSVIRLNKSYSNKRTRFKVTAALQKDTQQEIEQTQYNVQEDRKLHIQAALVRVMKARKKLKHNQLIEEAISQVRSRFTPNVQVMKKCIEALIDKQYLERDTSSKDTYSYVA